MIASFNEGKAEELAELLAPYGLRLLFARDVLESPPDETGNTFLENAALKARTAAELLGVPSLGEDSGFSVTALRGAPGVHTARFAARYGGYESATRVILQRLQGERDRSASYHAALCLAFPAPSHGQHPSTLFSAEHGLPGHVSAHPRGPFGSGFDPIFQPTEQGRTLAEMSPRERAAYHPRGVALERLAQRLPSPAG